MEIDSFHAFAPYQIQFIENLAEQLASAIGAAQANRKTRQLLLDTQQKAEIMGAQEEEMKRKEIE